MAHYLRIPGLDTRASPVHTGLHGKSKTAIGADSDVAGLATVTAEPKVKVG
jgi:hypothetical protein